MHSKEIKMLNCHVNKILTFYDKRADSYEKENVDVFNFFYRHISTN